MPSQTHRLSAIEICATLRDHALQAKSVFGLNPTLRPFVPMRALEEACCAKPEHVQSPCARPEQSRVPLDRPTAFVLYALGMAIAQSGRNVRPTPRSSALCCVVLGTIATSCSKPAPRTLPEDDGVDSRRIEALATRAYTEAYPMLLQHRQLLSEAIASGESSTHLAPLNAVARSTRLPPRAEIPLGLYPEPNTLVARAWLDLRHQPQVLSVGAISASPYVSCTVVDAFTHTAVFLTDEQVARQPAAFLISTATWQGEVPDTVDGWFPVQSDFAYVEIRAYIDKTYKRRRVLKQMAKIALHPLEKAEETGQKQDPPPFLAWDETRFRSANFVYYLNQILEWTHVNPADRERWQQYKAIGIEAKRRSPLQELPREAVSAIESGVQAALHRIESNHGAHADSASSMPASSGKESTAQWQALDAVGDRAFHNGNPLRRARARFSAVQREPARGTLVFVAHADQRGHRLSGARSCELVFDVKTLPPAKAAWDLAAYDANTRDFISTRNPRTSLGSRNRLRVRRGQSTIHLSNAPPRRAYQRNWLPTPGGDFTLLLRLYSPEKAALAGDWQPPPIKCSEQGDVAS